MGLEACWHARFFERVFSRVVIMGEFDPSTVA